MTKIKICGLKRMEDIEAVNCYKPEYIGFVFAKSKRQVTIEQAKNLKKALHPEIQAVGVFVNERIDTIKTICEEQVIDVIQLHGDEDISYIKMLRESVAAPIIKAIRVQSKEQILEEMKLPVEYLLCDTYTKDAYGGCGETFSHEHIPDELQQYFLAGGLNSENITDIIRQTAPYCVDVSSGVETDGVKDAAKIKTFIHRVRECNDRQSD